MPERIDYNTLNNAARIKKTGLTRPFVLPSFAEPASLDEVIAPNNNSHVRASLLPTTLQVAALLGADEREFNKFSGKTEKVEKPTVGNLEFSRNLHNLPRYGEILIPQFISDSKSITNLVRHMVTSLERRSGGHLYSPYFNNGRRDSQIDAYPLIQPIISDLQQASGRRSAMLRIIPPQQRRRFEIIDSLTSANLLPTSIAASKYSGILNPGAINTMMSTTFGRGDAVTVLAQYDDYSLVINGETYGWIENQKLASIQEMEITKGMEKVYYSNGNPHFYKTKEGEKSVLLPGDTVYRQGEKYFVLHKDKTSQVFVQEIRGLRAEKVTSGFTSVQEAVNFFLGLRIPYIAGTYDCSEIVRRTFKLLGYHLGKYSGSITAEVEKALHKNEEEIQVDDLQQLADGIYLSSIYSGESSLHISFIVKTHGRTEIYSQQLIQESSAYSAAHILGPHVVRDLSSYKSSVDGKKLTVLKITQ